MSDPIKVGETVTWTHFTRRGSSIEMTAWEGPVVEIDGDRVIIKRRGKRYRVRAERVRRVGEQNELTEFVHDLAKKGNKDE